MVRLMDSDVCSQKLSFIAGRVRRQTSDYHLAQTNLGGLMQVRKALRGPGELLNLLTDVT